MPTYVVISLAKDKTALDAAVKDVIPEESRFRLKNDSGWLVVYDGISKELSNKLGITGQKEEEPIRVSSALVLSIGSYYGRGPSDMWEWLSLKKAP